MREKIYDGETGNISQPDTGWQQIYRRLAALDREVRRLSHLLDAPEEEDARTGCAGASAGGGILPEGGAAEVMVQGRSSNES